MGILVLQIIAAILAVFGLCCLVKVIAAIIFYPRNLVSAVIIGNESDVALLSELLGEAKNYLFRSGRERIVVVISDELMHGCIGEGCLLFGEYEDIIERYGAEWIVGEDLEKLIEDKE